MDKRNIVMITKQANHLFGLTGAKQAMIDKNTGQLRTDRLMDQHRRN